MLNKAHWIYNIPLAHRGLHNADIDENSIPSFQNALAHNFGIELDVHVTKDKQIVVIHDSTTIRTTGIEKIVLNSTYAELQELSLLHSKTKIPLLSDVFELVKGRVPLLIELKAENEIPPSLVPAVIEVVSRYPYPESIALQAFNPYVVKELKAQTKGILVGQLMSDELPNQSKFVQFLYRSLLILNFSKPDFISYEVQYINKPKLQRKRGKFPLLAWTIDNKDKQNLAEKYADNIIFEQIEI